MSSSLDRLNEHPLVSRAGSRDPLRNNPSLLRDKPLQLLFILVIDVHIFVIAETARTFLPHK